MSEYSPTFVNWAKTGHRPVGGAGGMVARGKPSDPADDLHIVFNKGGIEIKDKGAEAERAEFADARRNAVILKFPAGRPITSAPFFAPPTTPAPNGTVPPPATPTPGSSTRPTFTHADPAFPGIKEWWWTFQGRRISPIFRGDPDPAARGGPGIPRGKRPRE